MQLQGKLRIQHIKQKIEEKKDGFHLAFIGAALVSAAAAILAAILIKRLPRPSQLQKTLQQWVIKYHKFFYICKLDILYFCLFLYNIINDKKRSCMQYDG